MKFSDEQAKYFDQVTKLIEDTYTKNGNKPVILLTHSMGSTMMLYLLNHKDQAWKDKYIRCQISLSGVWAGTVRAMKVFAVGDNLGSGVISIKALKREQRTSPSLAWLMPNLDFWSSDEILLKSDNLNITKANFEDFYKGLNASDGLEMWKDTKNLIKDLTPPGIELFCLYSYDVATTEQLIYHKFPESNPVKKSGDGDGTVNIRSLKACENWSGKQFQPVKTKAFRRLDHQGILKDPSVIQYVQDLVKDILKH